MSSTSLKPLLPSATPFEPSTPGVVEDVSFFDTDDEDDEDERESAAMKLKKILHIRAASSDHSDEPAERDASQQPRTGKGLRRLRKSLSDAASDANETLKSVFRPKHERVA